MATPKKRSEYAKAAEAEINTQVDLVDAVGRALDSLKALEDDYAAKIERGRDAYAEAYQAAIDGGWKASQLTRYQLPTPKSVASGRYAPARPKTKGAGGGASGDADRPSLSVVPDNPDDN